MMFSRIDKIWESLPPLQKAVFDVLAHVGMGFWVLSCLAGLTFYLGNICAEMFLYCGILSLGMIPIRIIAVKLLRDSRRSHCLDHILRETLYDLKPRKKRTEPDLDDDLWFLRNY
jgi:hypothetical protein